MKIEEKDLFNNYFKNLSNRERAIFEGGITLGALFHQFIGTPVSRENKKSIEKAIEKSLLNQPCVYEIEVKLKNIPKEGYTVISGDMYVVKLKTKVNNVVAILKLKYIKELNYPLMFVEEIFEV